VLQYNSGVGLTNSYSYSSKTGLQATLGASPNNFLFFNHAPQVTNIGWTNLQFWAASSSTAQFLIYFNGGYYQTKTLNPSWQLFTIALTSIGNPSASGAAYSAFGAPNQLVFQYASTASVTLYLNSVAFI